VQRAKRTCAEPGCSALVDSGKCATHKRQAQRAQDDRRGSAYERGYDRRWEKARAAFLAQHPVCALCQLDGQVTPAWGVDHVIPHRGNPILFWLPGNWQPVCEPCHNAKRARENGLAPCGHGEAWVAIGVEMVCVRCGERRECVNSDTEKRGGWV
jgi:5-methylcytosine-specific restriction protein A